MSLLKVTKKFLKSWELKNISSVLHLKNHAIQKPGKYCVMEIPLCHGI